MANKTYTRDDFDWIEVACGETAEVKLLNAMHRLIDQHKEGKRCLSEIWMLNHALRHLGYSRPSDSELRDVYEL